MVTSLSSVVKAHIGQIVDGLERGARLPSERALASSFAVSRRTVRSSVQALVSEGRVVRDRRRGMFVADPKHVVDLAAAPDSSSWPPSAAGVTSEVLGVRRRAASAEVAGELRIRPGDVVAVAERLLSLDGRPMALDTTMVPDARFPNLVEELTGETWPVAWLRAAWDVVLSHTETSIASEVAHDLDAVRLGGSAEQSLLVVRRVGYDEEDQPVLCSRERYRADRFTFVASMAIG